MRGMYRGSKYPIQKVLLISTDVAKLIHDVAETEHLSQTQVLRAFLHAGIRKAGYTDIRTTDELPTD